MSMRDELGARMKTFYEQIPKTKLMRRTPVIIRLDGKAFHTFTRGFQKPFDEILIKSMQETMKYLCENIQGCVLGYTQSDEITLILVDYKRLNSDAWFDYEVQKMCSIAASMATMAFNRAFEKEVRRWGSEMGYPNKPITESDIETTNRWFKYHDCIDKGAMFDARVFNIPKEEVANLIYWRQLDATRNSIQMVGQANFSHNELQNKSCNAIQDMLFQERDINWNDYPTHLKRGSCCVKSEATTTCAKTVDGQVITWAAERPHWEIDLEIPIFKEEGRQYINSRILYDDGEPKPAVIF